MKQWLDELWSKPNSGMVSFDRRRKNNNYRTVGRISDQIDTMKSDPFLNAIMNDEKRSDILELGSPNTIQ